MTPSELADAVRAAVLDAVADGTLALDATAVPTTVHVERPRQRAHGDWSTNIALQVGRRAGTDPRALAAELARRLGGAAGIRRVDVAGPGFLNFTLDTAAAGELARTIVEAGSGYGRSDAQAGQRINLEFVSANPTGPIHIGGVRWAAVGDSLARLLQACGADVTREYYFNDHGGQIDRFALSLLARARGRAAPEDGYGGQYIDDIAARVVADTLAAGEPDPTRLPDDQAQEVFRARGVDLMFAEIKQSLHDFGVDFDVYFHEDSLHESGAVARAIARLRELGHIYENDGATWLRTTTFGDDKDRVVVKSDGSPAYIAADLAYYLHKRERGFDRVVIMLGADHHGYIGRMMAMCAAFGDTPRVNLEILIGQLVNLVQGRRAGADEQASRLRGDHRRPGGRGRGRRGAVRARPVRRPTPRSTSTWTCWPAPRRRTRSTTCSTRTPGRSTSPGTPPTPTSAVRTASTPPCSTTRPRPSCSVCSPRCRGSSPRPRSCGSRTGWRATWKSWPAPTTSGTTCAEWLRSATSRWTTPTAPGCGSTTPPARCSPTGSACLA